MRSNLVQETTDKIGIVQDKLSIAQSRYKSYTDYERRSLNFEIKDYVFSKYKLEKFAPPYIKPFHVIKHIEDVAYQLELPPTLS